MKKTQIHQFRRTCIFCGGSGKLSEEHVIGNWIRKVIPRVQTEYKSYRTSLDFSNDKVQVQPMTKIKQGHPGTIRLKIVCEKCNNEWLSANFETPVKPVITKLLMANATELDANEQRIISLWMVKTCMVGEFISPTTRGIPATDLTYLRTNNTIPDGWFVYIGKYRGMDNFQYLHTRLTILSPELEKKSTIAEIAKMANSQRTVIVLGGLVLCAINCPLASVANFNKYMYDKYFEIIWPPTKGIINWPSRIPLDDNQLMRDIEGQDLRPI